MSLTDLVPNKCSDNDLQMGLSQYTEMDSGSAMAILRVAQTHSFGDDVHAVSPNPFAPPPFPVFM